MLQHLAESDAPDQVLHPAGGRVPVVQQGAQPPGRAHVAGHHGPHDRVLIGLVSGHQPEVDAGLLHQLGQQHLQPVGQQALRHLGLAAQGQKPGAIQCFPDLFDNLLHRFLL